MVDNGGLMGFHGGLIGISWWFDRDFIHGHICEIIFDVFMVRKLGKRTAIFASSVSSVGGREITNKLLFFQRGDL